MLNRDEIGTGADASEAPKTVCMSCGGAIEPGWFFCRGCGGALMLDEEAPAPLEPPAVTPIALVEPAPPGRRRWIRIAIAGTVAAVALAGLTVGVVNDVQTHRGLSDTQKRLSTTSASLATTRSSLASTRQQLSATQDEAASTLTDLANARRDLAGVSNTVAQQKSQLDSNATEIHDLDLCLGGVFSFIDQAGNGDLKGAVATLNGVQSICTTAYDNLPN